MQDHQTPNAEPQSLDDLTHDLLSELAGIDTHDTDLRDHPGAYAVVERFVSALPPSKPAAAGEPQMPEPVAWSAPTFNSFISHRTKTAYQRAANGFTYYSVSLTTTESARDYAEALAAARVAAERESWGRQLDRIAEGVRLYGAPDKNLLADRIEGLRNQPPATGSAQTGCGCRQGECESKPTGCRMATEVAQRDPRVM